MSFFLSVLLPLLLGAAPYGAPEPEPRAAVDLLTPWPGMWVEARPTRGSDVILRFQGIENSPRAADLDGEAFLLATTNPNPTQSLQGFVVETIVLTDGQVRLPLPDGLAGVDLTVYLIARRGPDVLVSPLMPLQLPHRVTGGRIDPSTIAVFANSTRPQSLDVAVEYLARREIPTENLRILDLNPDAPNSEILYEDDFNALVQPVIDSLPPEINMIALTWTFPTKILSRTDSRRQMSITSAFMFGTSQGHFNAPAPNAPCVYPAEIKRSALFKSTRRDYGAAGLPRPTMMLVGSTYEEVLDLIDRGIASDGTHPGFKGKLIHADLPRSNPREVDMMDARDTWAPERDVQLEYARIGLNPHPVGTDLMLYQTGDFRVEDVLQNGFLPGAAADHLTSFGGNLRPNSTGQMSVLAWLAAGATGSYGTVREPCSSPQKFPKTTVFLDHYLAGESLGEAYAKSIVFPQEGIFVGDPAACPYCPDEGVQLMSGETVRSVR